MFRTLIIFCAVLTVALIAGCGSNEQETASRQDSQTTAASGQEGAGQASGAVHVAARDYEFVPQEVVVNKGDTVVWTNEGQVEHSVTSGTDCSSSGDFNSWIGPGETFSHTFTETGEHPYFCIPHCAAGMTGTVTVRE